MARKSTKAATSGSGKTATSTNTTATHAVTAPSPLPIKAGVKTFFDLPGEIRNQVYAELLPDADDVSRAAEGWRNPRKDRQETSTMFMCASKLVYEEASSVLYDQLNQLEDPIQLSVRQSGCVSLLGKSTELDDQKAGSFAVLKRVKNLRLDVSTRETGYAWSICDVQDALFAIVQDLGNNHTLHSLDLHIHTPGQADYGLEMFSLSYADRMYPRAVMQEFRDVAPGDLSRAHIAAFLADPIRGIRGVKDGKKKGKFTLDFVGKSGRPWREIQGQVHSLIQGETAVPDYAIFLPYFNTLRQLKNIFRTTGFKSELSAFNRLSTLASAARIRGDLMAFREAHDELLKSTTKSVRSVSDFDRLPTRQETAEHEEACREVEYLCEELKATLPAEDSDTSFFGYNIADEGLLEWQTHGRAEEKEAKKERKRKRETEAKTKSAKTAKVDDE